MQVDWEGWFPNDFGQRTTAEQWIKRKVQHRNTGLCAQKCPIYQKPHPLPQPEMLGFMMMALKEEPTSYHGLLVLLAWDLHQSGPCSCPENLAGG